MRTLILTGPTASGKSQLAADWARRLPQIEIINADSLIVYKGVDIGSAKPSFDEMREIPHHLIDVLDPDQSFTAAQFVRLVKESLAEIHARSNRALIVGGTGFYLKALLFGVWDAPKGDLDFRRSLEGVSLQELYARVNQADPQSAIRIGSRDRYRLVRALEIIHLGQTTPEELNQRHNRKADPQFILGVIDRTALDIDARVLQRCKMMLDLGVIDEYVGLKKRYPKSRVLNAVGYKQIGHYLEGITPQGRKIKPGIQGLIDEMALATRQLVKQQRTWFRSLCAGVEGSNQWLLEQDRAQVEKVLSDLYG